MLWTRILEIILEASITDAENLSRASQPQHCNTKYYVAVVYKLYIKVMCSAAMARCQDRGTTAARKQA